MRRMSVYKKTHGTQYDDTTERTRQCVSLLDQELTDMNAYMSRSKSKEPESIEPDSQVEPTIDDHPDEAACTQLQSNCGTTSTEGQLSSKKPARYKNVAQDMLSRVTNKVCH